jgi:hypothetical protein
MSNSFEHFKPLEKEIDSDNMKAIIQDVIDNKYLLFDPETMANYSADFSGPEPLFINIHNEIKGSGFGYIIFHDFLRRVGTGKIFFATDFTAPGSKLFQKAIDDGLIEKVSEASGLHRLTKWKVIGDPVKNLEKIRDAK